MTTKSTTCLRCTDGRLVATDEHCSDCRGNPTSNLDGHTMVCETCHGTGRKNVPCPDCAAG